MKLRDFLSYEKITVQCHDNPDADAIASGYGLYTYFKEKGKDVKLIYSGMYKISKDNLSIFVDELKIPIEYRDSHDNQISGLLITVDCQYGAKNVTRFEADEIAIIDHHKVEIEDVEMSHIIPTLGSCATVVWKMLKDADFDFDSNLDVQTALYYGLYSDTLQFTTLSNPVDRDMKDALYFNEPLLTCLQNSNISARELEIAGIAMIRAIINKEKRFAVVKSEPCDPNILGLISDFVLQVSEIDMCVVFNVPEHGIKYSVRSCSKNAMADHVARYVCKNIGSGGGHQFKAGGYISMDEYEKKFGDYDQVSYFANKLKDYIDEYEIVDALEKTYPVEGALKYRKKNVTVGYVKASDVLTVGEVATIRTLEGDLHVTIEDDLYIIIGVKGEIYPIRGEKFRKNYVPVDEPYTMELEYHPKAKLTNLSEEYSLLDYAKTCISTGENYIYAKPLDKGIKIFTAWDRDCYMLGEQGDYYAAKIEDLHDMYVIEKNIFGLTYELVE